MIPQRTNAAGRDLIKKAEGLRLKAYHDSVGVLTIGYGHTGPDVVEGQVVTPEQADALLQGDLLMTESAVGRMLRVKANENQFSALVSFAFNLGAGALRNSSLLRFFNAGNVQAAADQFLIWNHAGGEVLQGLTLRRKAERDLFLTPPVPAPA